MIPTIQHSGKGKPTETRFFEETSYCSPKWMHQFVFTPTAHKDFHFFTSLSTAVDSCVVNFSRSYRCEVVSHHGVESYFHNDE